MKQLVLAALLCVLARPAQALNWKTGIDLSLSGIEGTDYVIEQLYYDSLYDDRSVIYLKSSVLISMDSNDRNIMNMRNPEQIGVATDSGWIYYKIDGDGLQTGHPYGLGADGPEAAYSGPYYLYSGPIDFSSVKGQTGENDSPKYHHGIIDTFGDEWHVLTYWHDVGGGLGWGSESTTDDGKIVQVVLDPRTPVLSLICNTAAAEYYTTPAKQYYIAKIFTQTSFVNGDVSITLTNLQNSDPVQYKVDDGTWQVYTAPLSSSALFSTDDTRYVLSYRNGTDGAVKTRTFHFNPSSPTVNEAHPSKMCWHSETEKQALKSRLAGSPYSGIYGGWKNPVTWTGHTNRHHTGLRYGKREYMGTGGALAQMAFVAQMEGYDYESYSFANTAKEMLLNLYCIDPIGFEYAPIAGGRKAPCMERCAYPGDHKTPDIPLGYDLMAAYTTANGYADGFTPIQEYKVRDNLASEVNLRLKWLGVGYGDFWHNFLENAMAAFAIALPTYDTPYYGTSGADGTQASHPYAPFPDARISWWDYVNGIGEATGYPNLGAKSTFHNLYDGPFGLGIFGEDGYWYCDDFDGYQAITESGCIPSLAARARYDGVIPERFASRLDIHIRTRHPSTGKSTGANANGSFLQPSLRPLINSSVPDAGLYMWYQRFPDISRVIKISNSITDLLYFDNSIAMEPPVEQSKKYQSVLAFGEGTGNRDGIMLRMLNKYEDTDVSNYRVPMTTNFNLDAHGGMLVVDGVNGRDDNDGKTSEARNMVLVDDDGSTLNSGISKMIMGRIGPALLGGACEYGRVATRRDLRSSDGSPFYTNEVDQVRHVLFPDKKYFIIVDEMTSGTGSHTYGWTLHGSSDGSIDPSRFAVDNTANTVTWVKSNGVSLKAIFVTPDVDIDGSNTKSTYFTGQTEPYAIASAAGTDITFVTALLPLANGQTAPVLSDIPVSTGTAFGMDDGSGKVYCHTGNGTAVTVNSVYTSDGRISLVKTDTTGGFVYGTVVEGTQLTFGSTVLAAADAAMNIYYDTKHGGDTAAVLMVKPDTGGVEVPVVLTLGGLPVSTACGVYRDGQADTNVVTDGSGSAVVSILVLNDEFGQTARAYTVTSSPVGIFNPGTVETRHVASLRITGTNPHRIGETVMFTSISGPVTVYDRLGGVVVSIDMGNDIHQPRPEGRGTVETPIQWNTTTMEPGMYYIRSGNVVQKLMLVR